MSSSSSQAADDSKCKVLVVGNCEGKFAQVLARFESVNKSHGPFDLMVCLGSPFTVANEALAKEYMEGRKEGT
jgi:hypothetical protein